MKDQRNLFHRDGPDTERKALQRLGEERRNSLLFKVYSMIEQSENGLTASEICKRMPSVNPYSIRPRITELSSALLVFPSRDQRRKNDRGSEEIVWKSPIHGLSPKMVMKAVRSIKAQGKKCPHCGGKI